MRSAFERCAEFNELYAVGSTIQVRSGDSLPWRFARLTEAAKVVAIEDRLYCIVTVDDSQRMTLGLVNWDEVPVFDPIYHGC